MEINYNHFFTTELHTYAFFGALLCNNDNNNNGNLYRAFGDSKFFTITLKCGTHEKKKKKQHN